MTFYSLKGLGNLMLDTILERLYFVGGKAY